MNEVFRDSTSLTMEFYMRLVDGTPLFPVVSGPNTLLKAFGTHSTVNNVFGITSEVPADFIPFPRGCAHNIINLHRKVVTGITLVFTTPFKASRGYISNI